MAAGPRRELVRVSAIVLAAGLALTLAGVQHPCPNGRSLTPCRSRCQFFVSLHICEL